MNEKEKVNYEEESEYVSNEFEHKWLLLKQGKIKINSLFDFLKTQLQLSNISVTEATIYSNRMDCISDWYSMGLYELAERSYFKLLNRLSLRKSVSGFERLMQTGNVSSKISMFPGKPSKAEIENQEEDKNEIIEHLKQKIMKGE